MQQPKTTNTREHKEAIVFIVDDDNSVRRGLERLMRANGLRAETYASAAEFLETRRDYDGSGCLVLDVCMPGLDGLELQERLARSGSLLPILFISGRGDIPMSVRAMKAGAITFLTKPFTDQELLGAVREAMERGRVVRARKIELDGIRVRLDTLTARERQVFALVVTGMLNKQIGAELGIAEKTVKIHRARVMQKMRVESLAELVSLAERLKSAGPGRPTAPPG
jgi:FixJ family two-component response regulator